MARGGAPQKRQQPASVGNASHQPSHSRHPPQAHHPPPATRGRSGPAPPRSLPLGVPTGACKKEGTEVRAGARLPAGSSGGGGPRRGLGFAAGDPITGAVSSGRDPPTPALACDSQIMSRPAQKPPVALCCSPNEDETLLDDPQGLGSTDSLPAGLSSPTPHVWPASLFLEHIPVPGPLYVTSLHSRFLPGWFLTLHPDHIVSLSLEVPCHVPNQCLSLQDAGIMTTRSIHSQPRCKVPLVSSPSPKNSRSISKPTSSRKSV